MFIFLTLEGGLAGYTVLPAIKDEPLIGSSLSPYDQFGQSLSGYMDVDHNGLREIIVGAPGDDTIGHQAGAIYILFPRRRRYHYIPFDFLTFILLVTIMPGTCCLGMVCGTIYFFWYFRRIPDEAEIIVKKAGLKISATRTRVRYQKKIGHVYCEQYTV
jgi:hypothetical protein